jgi:hypothetical protein
MTYMTEESPYLFDNLEPNEQLHVKPMDLVQKNIPAEQWNYFYYSESDTEGFDGFDVVWNDLAQLIGLCLVVFSEGENELEHNLYNMINDRSDQLGVVIARTMSFEQKIQAYIDLLRLIGSDKGTQYKSDVDQLKKHLKRAGEVRNIIAHAKWASLTKEGYVFSSADAVSSVNSELNLKYFELNKEKLENYRAYLQAIANMLNYVQETHFES